MNFDDLIADPRYEGLDAEQRENAIKSFAELQVRDSGFDDQTNERIRSAAPIAARRERLRFDIEHENDSNAGFAQQQLDIVDRTVENIKTNRLEGDDLKNAVSTSLVEQANIERQKVARDEKFRRGANVARLIAEEVETETPSEGSSFNRAVRTGVGAFKRKVRETQLGEGSNDIIKNKARETLDRMGFSVQERLDLVRDQRAQLNSDKLEPVRRSTNGDVILGDRAFYLSDENLDLEFNQQGISRSVAARTKKQVATVRPRLLKDLYDNLQKTDTGSGVLGQDFKRLYADTMFGDDEDKKKRFIEGSLLQTVEEDQAAAQKVVDAMQQDSSKLDKALNPALARVQSIISGSFRLAGDEGNADAFAARSRVSQLKSSFNTAPQILGDVGGLIPDVAAQVVVGKFLGPNANVALRTASQSATAGLPQFVTTYADAKEQGLDEQESLLLGFKAGGITALVTALGAGSGVERVGAGITREAAKASFRGFLKETGEGFSKEALEEFSDEAINAYFVSTQLHPDLTPEEHAENALYAGFLGGLFGGGTAGVQTASAVATDRISAADRKTNNVVDENIETTETEKRSDDNTQLEQGVIPEQGTVEENTEEETEESENSEDAAAEESADAELSEESDATESESAIERADEVRTDNQPSNEDIEESNVEDPQFDSEGVRVRPDETTIVDESSETDVSEQTSDSVDDESTDGNDSQEEADSVESERLARSETLTFPFKLSNDLQTVEDVDAELDAVSRDFAADVGSQTLNAARINRLRQRRVELENAPTETQQTQTSSEQQGSTGSVEESVEVNDDSRVDQARDNQEESETDGAPTQNEGLTTPAEVSEDAEIPRVNINRNVGSKTPVSAEHNTGIRNAILEQIPGNTRPNTEAEISTFIEDVVSSNFSEVDTFTGLEVDRSDPKFREGVERRVLTSIVTAKNKNKSQLTPEFVTGVLDGLKTKNGNVKKNIIDAGINNVKTKVVTSGAVSIEENPAVQKEVSQGSLDSDAAEQLFNLAANLDDPKAEQFIQDVVDGFVDLDSLTNAEQILLERIRNAPRFAEKRRSTASRNIYVGSNETKFSSSETLISPESFQRLQEVLDVPLEQVVPKNKPLKQFTDLAKNAFGAPVVFVNSSSSLNPLNADGLLHEGVVYIDIRSQRPFETVIGHEAGHHFKNASPELYAEFQDFLINDNSDFYKNYIAARGIDKAYPTEELQFDEFTNDIIGSFVTDVNNMKRLESVMTRRNKNLFDKFMNWISGTLRNFLFDIGGFVTKRYSSATRHRDARRTEELKNFHKLNNSLDSARRLFDVLSQWKMSPTRIVKPRSADPARNTQIQWSRKRREDLGSELTEDQIGMLEGFSFEQANDYIFGDESFFSKHVKLTDNVIDSVRDIIEKRLSQSKLSVKKPTEKNLVRLIRSLADNGSDISDLEVSGVLGDIISDVEKRYQTQEVFEDARLPLTVATIGVVNNIIAEGIDTLQTQRKLAAANRVSAAFDAAKGSIQTANLGRASNLASLAGQMLNVLSRSKSSKDFELFMVRGSAARKKLDEAFDSQESFFEHYSAVRREAANKFVQSVKSFASTQNLEERKQIFDALKSLTKSVLRNAGKEIRFSKKRAGAEDLQTLAERFFEDGIESPTFFEDTLRLTELATEVADTQSRELGSDIRKVRKRAAKSSVEEGDTSASKNTIDKFLLGIFNRQQNTRNRRERKTFQQVIFDGRDLVRDLDAKKVSKDDIDRVAADAINSLVDNEILKTADRDLIEAVIFNDAAKKKSSVDNEVEKAVAKKALQEQRQIEDVKDFVGGLGEVRVTRESQKTWRGQTRDIIRVATRSSNASLSKIGSVIDSARDSLLALDVFSDAQIDKVASYIEDVLADKISTSNDRNIDKLKKALLSSNPAISRLQQIGAVDTDFFTDFKGDTTPWSGLSQQAKEGRVADIYKLTDKDLKDAVADIDSFIQQDDFVSEAESLFEFSKKPKSKKQQIAKVIFDRLQNDPTFFATDTVGKFEILKEYVQDTEAFEGDIDSIVASLIPDFNRKFEELARQDIADLALQLKNGSSIESDTFRNVIRKGLLDSSQDVGLSLANELDGFNITPELTARLEKIQSDLIEIEQRGQRGDREWQRLHNEAVREFRRNTDISPSTRSVIISAFKASLYSGIGTSSLSLVASITSVTGDVVAGVTRDIFNGIKNADPQTFGSTISGFVEGVRAGVDAAISDLSRGTAPNEVIRIDQQDVNAINASVSPLLLKRDQAINSLRNRAAKKPSLTNYAKMAKDVLDIFVSSQNYVFSFITAMDTISNEAIISMTKRAELEHQVQDNNLTRVEFRQLMSDVKKDVENHFHDYIDAGYSVFDARSYARERADADLYEKLLGDGDLDAASIWTGAENRARGITGNHQEVAGGFSFLLDKLDKVLGINDPNQSLTQQTFQVVSSMIMPARRIVGNVTDRFLFSMPLVNIGLNAAVARRAREAQGLTDQDAIKDVMGWTYLLAGQDFQRRQLRQNMYFTNALTAGLIAAVLGQAGKDDEDKPFFVTAGYPDDKKSQKRFRENNLKTHSIYLNTPAGRLQLSYGRGVFQLFSPVFMTVARYEDVAENRASSLEAANGLMGDVTSMGLSWLISAAKTVEIFDSGDDKNIVKQSLFRTTALAPYAGLSRNVTKALHPYKLRPQSTADAFYASVPQLSALMAVQEKTGRKTALSEIPVTLDRWGNKVQYSPEEILGLPWNVTKTMTETPAKFRELKEVEKNTGYIFNAYQFGNFERFVLNKLSEDKLSNLRNKYGVDNNIDLFAAYGNFRATTINKFFAQNKSSYQKELEDAREITRQGIRNSDTPEVQESINRIHNKIQSIKDKATRNINKKFIEGG